MSWSHPIRRMGFPGSPSTERGGLFATVVARISRSASTSASRASEGGIGGSEGDDLLRLDPDTGAVLERIGPFTTADGGELSGLQDLVFDPASGQFFAFDGGFFGPPTPSSASISRRGEAQVVADGALLQRQSARGPEGFLYAARVRQGSGSGTARPRRRGPWCRSSRSPGAAGFADATGRAAARDQPAPPGHRRDGSSPSSTSRLSRFSPSRRSAARWREVSRAWRSGRWATAPSTIHDRPRSGGGRRRPRRRERGGAHARSRGPHRRRRPLRAARMSRCGRRSSGSPCGAVTTSFCRRACSGGRRRHRPRDPRPRCTCLRDREAAGTRLPARSGDPDARPLRRRRRRGSGRNGAFSWPGDAGRGGSICAVCAGTGTISAGARTSTAGAASPPPAKCP